MSLPKTNGLLFDSSIPCGLLCPMSLPKTNGLPFDSSIPCGLLSSICVVGQSLSMLLSLLCRHVDPLCRGVVVCFDVVVVAVVDLVCCAVDRSDPFSINCNCNLQKLIICN